MKWLKARLKSKTYWYVHSVAIFGIVEANVHLSQEYFGSKYWMVYLLIAVLGYFIREVTDAPVTKKES